MAANERALFGMGHLLGPEGEHHVVDPGRHHLPGQVGGGGGGGTRVLHVDDRDPTDPHRPETELPGEHLLTGDRTGDRVGEVSGLDVADADPGVLDCLGHRWGTSPEQGTASPGSTGSGTGAGGQRLATAPCPRPWPSRPPISKRRRGRWKAARTTRRRSRIWSSRNTCSTLKPASLSESRYMSSGRTGTSTFSRSRVWPAIASLSSRVWRYCATRAPASPPRWRSR